MPREAQKVLRPVRGQLKHSDIEVITEPGKYRHHEIKQLSLYVQGGEDRLKSASWVFKYSSPTQYKAGKKLSRTKGFGAYDKDKIAVVERKAREWAALLVHGKDPSDQLDAAKEASKAASQFDAFASPTYKEVFDLYIEHKRGGWTKRASGQVPISERNWLQSANYAKDFWSKPFGKVTYEMVVRSIEEVWNRDKPDAANRYFKRTRDFVRWWCRKHKQLKSELFVNMPEKIEEFEFKHQRVERRSFKSIPWDQMPQFWATLAALPMTEGVVALKLAVLTGARPVEMRELRWSQLKTYPEKGDCIEIAPNKETGEVTKTGSVYLFPLTSEVRELIEFARENFGTSKTWVLPSPNKVSADRPLSEAAARNILEKIGFKGRATVHGFRTSLKTFALERLGVEPYIAESLLQHKINGNYFAPREIWEKQLRVYSEYHKWLREGANG